MLRKSILKVHSIARQSLGRNSVRLMSSVEDDEPPCKLCPDVDSEKRNEATASDSTIEDSPPFRSHHELIPKNLSIMKTFELESNSTNFHMISKGH
ncbi:CLUMA_CG018674, isoform A [Clunio marinus]|uniref:CLUMA_CG018674, isoform A n=1 Tax=Clunio marinus TaxID=568069 RepID=A0A1J1IZ74_9DIPT|nr:CLUMA_CG018674, isoform A [Clunio marinus]